MYVTGFKIREQIRKLELLRETAVNSFNSSLYRFENETKQNHPTASMRLYSECERKIAALQTLQSIYNLRVKIKVGDRAMTLCEAVKSLGGAGRAEKLWRTATLGKKDRYYSGDDLVRRDGEERAQPTISATDMLFEATKAAEYAGTLRAAIAEGNGVQVDLEIEAGLFE